ncbi:MAG: ribonuclease P protein component [Planctomycetota bacterium]
MVAATEQDAQNVGRTLVFRPRHRLTHAREFRAVFDAKLRKGAGPLTVFVRESGRADLRLGLSIGRRVGGAVERNRVKRMIREAFRHERGVLLDRCGPLDLVVSSRAHARASLADYRGWLRSATERAARELGKRRARDGVAGGPDLEREKKPGC